MHARAARRARGSLLAAGCHGGSAEGAPRRSAGRAGRAGRTQDPRRPARRRRGRPTRSSRTTPTTSRRRSRSAARVRGKIDAGDATSTTTASTSTKAGALQVSCPASTASTSSLELEDAGGNVLAKLRSRRRARQGGRPEPRRHAGPLHCGRARACRRRSRRRRSRRRQERGRRGAEPPRRRRAPVYELTAQLAPPVANAEREPDDDRGTANDLIVGDTGDRLPRLDRRRRRVEALGRDAVGEERDRRRGLARSRASRSTLEIADGVGQPLATRKAPRGAAARSCAASLPVVPAGAPPFSLPDGARRPLEPRDARTSCASPRTSSSPTPRSSRTTRPRSAMRDSRRSHGRARRRGRRATSTASRSPPARTARTLDVTDRYPARARPRASSCSSTARSIAKADHGRQGRRREASRARCPRNAHAVKVRVPTAPASVRRRA